LAGPDGWQGPPSLPKPGAEHQLFKMDEGTWDAAIEVSPPDGPAMTSKGVEVNTIGCGGMCIITDFKGEAMPGVPFAGHGVGTWDTVKKKYVVSWTDSMSQGLAIGEASWDPAKKQLAGWVEGPDMTGKVMKMRTLGEYKAPDTRVFTSFAPGPDGKEIQTMRITYTRRKAAQ
jgi:hypothetical protein